MHVRQASATSLFDTDDNSVGTANLPHNQSFRIPKVSLFEFLFVAVLEEQ
jgi:hypothetical protein